MLRDREGGNFRAECFGPSGSRVVLRPCCFIAPRVWSLERTTPKPKPFNPESNTGDELLVLLWSIKFVFEKAVGAIRLQGGGLQGAGCAGSIGIHSVTTHPELS